MTLLAETAGFDLTRLSDYGVLGVVCAALMYSINNIGSALKTALENRAIDARADLAVERTARQNFEARMAVVLDTLIKSVSDLSAKVGQKTESIDQLTGVIRELFDLVHEVKRETVAKNGGGR